MNDSSQTIHLHTLVLEVIPRVKSTERLLRGSLSSSLNRSQSPESQARRQEQLAALDLTVKTFRLNVEPLLHRHPEALAEVIRDQDCSDSPLLALDALQAEALSNLQALCDQVQQLYGGAGGADGNKRKPRSL